MAYARHALLQFGGRLMAGAQGGAGGEEWSCNLRVAYDYRGRPDTDLNPDEQDQYLNDTAVPALTSWFTDSDTRITTSTSLDYAKFNAIAPNGQYVNDVTTVADFEDVYGSANAGQGGKYPSQVSLALTFVTGVTRGRAKLGRIYLPGPGHDIGSEGLISPAQATQTAQRTVSLLEALDNDDVSMGIRFTPVVASPLVSGGGSTGPMNPITAVRVDSRFDIQRRRANSLIGARFEFSLSK